MKTTSKKIIIIKASEVAPDVRVEKIAQSLTDIGHTVKIIAWDRSLSLQENEHASFGEIHRIKIRADYGSGIKLLPKLIFFWIKISFLLFNEKFDALHACDFDTILPALLVAKIKNKKIIYDIFDFYAEGANIPKKLRPIIRTLDNMSMRRSDVVVVVDEVRLPYLPESIRGKTEIIYNSPTDMYLEIKNNSKKFPRIPRKNTDTFRIVYSGNLIDDRYILEMIWAVAQIPDAEFIIAGFGQKSFIGKIETAVKNTKNVHYIGKNSSLEESLTLEDSADLLFALNSVDVPNNKMMSANKFFEAMMLEKPILVNRGTSMEEKVRKYDCGIIIDTVTPEILAQTIREVRKNQERMKQMGIQGRLAFLRNYRWEFMEEKLKNIYNF